MGTVSNFVDKIVIIQNMFIIHSGCSFMCILDKRRESANIQIAFSPFFEPWMIDDTLL